MPPTIAQTKTLYEGWLKIIGVRVRLEDGEEVRREVEDHGRAVAVLPYDPQWKMTKTLPRARSVRRARKPACA